VNSNHEIHETHESRKRTDDPEQKYSRENGAELGPVGIGMAFLLMTLICPLLIWDCVKAVVLAGRDTKKNLTTK